MLLEPVIGYTRVVFATKFILSSIALILILILILFPTFSPVHDNFRITFSSIENDGESEDPKMISPRFQGVDKDDQTYNISAKTAIKQKNETLILDQINASINLKDGSWVTLLANTGTFKHKENSLKLSDSVNLFTNNGYEFYTKSINIDIKNNLAYGFYKIHGHGPIGSITADSFEAIDKGQRAIFKGNVTVNLNQEIRKHINIQDK